MPRTALGPYRIKDYLNTSDVERWELIYGYLIHEPDKDMGEPGYHAAVDVELSLLLCEAAKRGGKVAHDVGFSFAWSYPMDCVVLVPDVCYVPNDQLSEWVEDWPVQSWAIPALVVDVLSPSTRSIDIADKLEIYGEAGVTEYWIFDGSRDEVRVYRFAENREKPVAVKSFEDTLTTPLLPGFSLEMPKVR